MSSINQTDVELALRCARRLGRANVVSLDPLFGLFFNAPFSAARLPCADQKDVP
jgi:hypothetical protein